MIRTEPLSRRNSTRSWASPKWTLISFILFLVIGCEVSEQEQNEYFGDDYLPQETIDAIDKIPVFTRDIHDLVLSDGTPITEYLSSANTIREGEGDLSPRFLRNQIISKMLARATQLANRSLWQFADTDPPQFGLGYSYGSKDPYLLQSPTNGGCIDRLHGLDCSGFIYQCALAAGLSIPVGPSSLQGNPDVWNAAIPREWGVFAQQVKDSKYKAGDLIVWDNHIAIIGENNSGSGLEVIQSNGTPAIACGKSCSAECEKNKGPSRGPRWLTINNALKYFGKKFKVIRLTYKTIKISPENVILPQGQEQVFTAAIYDEDDNEVMSQEEISWQVNGVALTPTQGTGRSITLTSGTMAGNGKIMAKSDRTVEGSADVSVSDCQVSIDPVQLVADGVISPNHSLCPQQSDALYCGFNFQAAAAGCNIVFDTLSISLSNGYSASGPWYYGHVLRHSMPEPLINGALSCAASEPGSLPPPFTIDMIVRYHIAHSNETRSITIPTLSCSRQASNELFAR